MFNFLKKKQEKGSMVQFKITGMHCVSCAMTIDDELEEQSGVMNSDTNYAKGITKVVYEETKISPIQLIKVIEALDYFAIEVKK